MRWRAEQESADSRRENGWRTAEELKKGRLK